jgi:glycosyltransferase involved in cell wall biosynthesis
MKILFYNHTGKVGGAEGLLLMILSRLDRERFDPIVVCAEQGPLLKQVRELAVPAEIVAGLEARFTWRVDQFLRYLKSFVQVIRELRQKVVSIKPDLIHANSIRAGLVATAATLGLETRVVWHVHDLLPRHPLSIAIRTFAFLSRRTRMIAVSQAAADRFCGAVLPWKGRVTVILNAIDLEKFHPNENAKHELRDELQLRDADFVIGIVGRLTPSKGQVELLHAFAQVRHEIPHAKLVMVGAPLFNREHEYLELLKQTASELGIAEHVRITGARDDVAAIMQTLDLLVINSTVEAFCLVALEGMAAGTPILAAVSGGIPELIEHGKNGWLLPKRDKQTLVAAILKLNRQPALRKQLSQQGRRHVTAHFSASHYLDKLQAFYALECADLSALLPVATCRDHGLFESLQDERRQDAAGQSGEWRGPQRGSRDGVLSSPHSKELTLINREASVSKI